MVGDTINIASRLQGEAAGGEVLLTEDAYDAVCTAFPHNERRQYQLKGIAQPIVAHAVKPPAIQNLFIDSERGSGGEIL
jgi:class 3 adenylate cyclase